ncbi:voltage-dependent ion-selective channel [Rickenella mellea]|uniref:Voltage-dependent ion-selective channel n=1 Tax=Rickenella mellea TaxID=50990 RepID=A0A4Y7Q7D6_9AGAM|nr:voltage-dependent ion-selective channel [Rickenella mellea]
MSLPQPVPPSWKDLGKSSNDLLSKDFPIGKNSLEVKTTTPSNVVFKVAGHHIDDNPVIEALAEAKYTDRKNGLVFTQGWTSINSLLTQVELENQVVNGLKLDLTTVLPPSAQGAGPGEKPKHKDLAKSAIFNAIYKQPGLHSRASLNLFRGPTFTADAVVGHDGFLLGAEASYNVSTGLLEKYAAAVGFSAPEYAVTVQGTENFANYSASYYHRVSRDVEAGGKVTYIGKKASEGVQLEVGTKAYLDSAAFIKAKINNAGLLSLGYTQALRPGVKASFGLSLDTQRFNSAFNTTAHKVGTSFVFEG